MLPKTRTPSRAALIGSVFDTFAVASFAELQDTITHGPGWLLRESSKFIDRLYAPFANDSLRGVSVQMFGFSGRVVLSVSQSVPHGFIDASGRSGHLVTIGILGCRSSFISHPQVAHRYLADWALRSQGSSTTPLDDLARTSHGRKSDAKSSLDLLRSRSSTEIDRLTANSMLAKRWESRAIFRQLAWMKPWRARRQVTLVGPATTDRGCVSVFIQDAIGEIANRLFVLGRWSFPPTSEQKRVLVRRISTTESGRLGAVVPDFLRRPRGPGAG